ncbi:hypothetical protein, partial [Escherichia coli]|uniref:hypothetical protein n=1 Tax=Escherichia coli TaxID=562 RepID=UPI00215881E2
FIPAFILQHQTAQNGLLCFVCTENRHFSHGAPSPSDSRKPGYVKKGKRVPDVQLSGIKSR